LESVTLYLDDSGDPGWPPPVGKSKIQNYVLGGLAISPEADFQAKEGVENLLAKYVPPAQKAKYPPALYEIHYHDIIRGHNLFDHLDHPQRKALSDELFNLILGLKPVLFASVVKKAVLKMRYGSDAFHPRSYALRATRYDT
jgi:hypothetical protein